MSYKLGRSGGFTVLSVMLSLCVQSVAYGIESRKRQLGREHLPILSESNRPKKKARVENCGPGSADLGHSSDDESEGDESEDDVNAEILSEGDESEDPYSLENRLARQDDKENRKSLELLMQKLSLEDPEKFQRLMQEVDLRLYKASRQQSPQEQSQQIQQSQQFEEHQIQQTQQSQLIPSFRNISPPVNRVVSSNCNNASENRSLSAGSFSAVSPSSGSTVTYGAYRTVSPASNNSDSSNGPVSMSDDSEGNDSDKQMSFYE